MQTYKFGDKVKCPHCGGVLDETAQDYFVQGPGKVEGEMVEEECGSCYMEFSMQISHEKGEVYVSK